MTLLKVEGLTKRFGRFTALHGVDMQLEAGEIFGFIGPNGAGKTTTLRILMGVIRATGGQATVFGQDAWRDAVEIHKRVAYVPGDVNLWSNLTGGEVIDFFARLRGSRDHTQQEQLMQRFELDPSKKCRTYSKGNRQKVALVAAFASQADLYILDEPTSGLDPLMEQVFRECVRDAQAQGKTILLSSHILSEVEQLCDRVGIIRQGRMVETGTLNELRHLTRIGVTLETRQPVEGLAAVPGVYGLEPMAAGVRFQVDTGALAAVVSHVAPFGVTKLESAPPTLEDLFMRHYHANGGEGA